MMTTKKLLLLTTFTILISAMTVSAQGIVDGFFDKQGDLKITTSYTRTSFDELYVGEDKVGPVPVHNQINQNIYSLYSTYGVTDRLTVIAKVPYISAEGEGGPDPVNGQTEQKDFQDISLYGKYKLNSSSFSGGKVDFLTALGFNIPTGYEPNGLLSLGSGAFTTDLHLGAQLNIDGGFFTSFVGGYSFRGEANNEFGNGDGSDFDVPNAFLATGKVGFSSAKIYVEAWVDYQQSSDGIDIGSEGFGGRFPLTEVNYTRLGSSVYVPVTSLIGVSAGYGTVVDGRNLGDSNFYNVGVTFKINTFPTNTEQ